ncbi:MAG: hypothetical protein R3F62_25695 [Planctomycetota bacterium]
MSFSRYSSRSSSIRATPLSIAARATAVETQGRTRGSKGLGIR